MRCNCKKEGSSIENLKDGYKAKIITVVDKIGYLLSSKSKQHKGSK